MTKHAVHTAPHRWSWTDSRCPQRPQHLLLLLVFSSQEKTHDTEAVDAQDGRREGTDPPIR